jgi:hypothetical protein
MPHKSLAPELCPVHQKTLQHMPPIVQSLVLVLLSVKQNKQKTKVNNTVIPFPVTPCD